MKRNFIKIFLRNLKRHRVISSINAIGLVFGILSALMILEYVYYERSYDSHHTHANDIYRLAYNRYDDEDNTTMWETANSFFPAGAWLEDNYSEVVKTSRITPKHNITISHLDANNNKVVYTESKAFYGTRSMFEVFDIPVLIGDYITLDKPFTVAMSQQAAKKYFGKQNPIGQTITVNGEEDYTVSVIYENIPSNSIIISDFFFSMETMYHFRPGLRTVWGYDYGTTYVQLKPGTDYLSFSKKALPKMVEDNYKKRLDRSNQRDEFYLQPLRKIHLTSNIEYETVPPGNEKIIDILAGFSLFLLIIAWINYVNLMTASAVDRAKEIGVRKVNGASKLHIIGQFIGEAFLFNLLSLFITLLLFITLNPAYKALVGIDQFNLFQQAHFVSSGILIFMLGIIVSCLYPALVLQSYQPIAVLKGKFKHSGDGIFFRKGMISLQFIISIVMLSGTLVAKRQANYLMEKDMGIDHTQCLVIKAPQTGEKHGVVFNKLLNLKNEVINIPQVEAYTFTSDVPLREIESWFGFQRKGYDSSDRNGYFHLAVDDQFMDFNNIKIIAGRKFFNGETSASGSIIMNQKAIERMGESDPDKAVNTVVIRGGKEMTVVGVTNDFYYMSIKNEPVPTVITLNNPPKKYMMLRINTQQNTNATVAKVKERYTEAFPGQPFDYYWLEDRLNQDLKPDKTFATVFGLFSILAILIAVIGIIGLILITIGQRMKEIGVRKVLGSSLMNVTQLLIKEVALQFLLAMIIAIPLAWYGYQHWFLDSYLHSIELSLGMFLFPAIILFAIIYGVVFMLAKRAFSVNVAKVLQSE